MQIDPDLKLSVVLSLFNEEQSIPAFWAELHRVLNQLNIAQIELLWVNDGSTDNSQSIIDSISSGGIQNHIRHVSIEFSKNFGHEAAMIAGIDNATGDVIICMDSDGQHPPSEIPAMLAAHAQGSDIVLMERVSRGDKGPANTILSRVFYRFINFLSSVKIEKNSSDFYLLSAEVATIFRENYREKVRFIRASIQSVGFTTQTLSFVAPARAHGESKYSYVQLLNLAFNAVFSYSNRPLRLSMFFSIVFVLFSLFLIGYTLIIFIAGEKPPSGYTTIILFLSLSFSSLFVTLTVISLYFEKIIEEMRQRPLYIIKSLRRNE